MKFKSITLAALAGLSVAMVSCSNDDSIAPSLPDNSDGRIGFSTYISRAGSTTSDNISNFGVFAYLNGGAAYDGASIPDFMWNQSVVKSGAEWSYNPIKYWPNDATHKISFLGYAPYVDTPAAAVADGVTGLTNSSITAFSANDAAGDATLNFEVGTDISEQVDLVYAKAMDQTNAVQTVNLDFKHALSRLSFAVTGWEDGTGETFDDNTTVTVNSVKICTPHKSATLNLKTGLWSDVVNYAGDTYKAYTVATRYSNIQNNVLTSQIDDPENPGTKINNTGTYRLNLDDDYIMMFPDLAYAISGADPDVYYIYVDYTIKTIDAALEDGYVEMRHNIFRSIAPQFEAGKSYVINIHLGLNGYTGPDDGGDDDGDIPDEDDPDDDTPDPVHPTDAGYVKLTMSCTDWESASSLELPLVKN